MSTQTFPPNVLKRIKKDYTDLIKEPVINAGAKPREDDLTFWDAVILVEVTNSDKKLEKVPLHFLIEFPQDYPQSAPNIGFSYKFAYHLGAAYVESKPGKLKNKFVLCLDLLGNFSGIHTEWKDNVGSGWSPAYTVTSLLINLQAVLSELDSSYNGSGHGRTEAMALIKSAEEFRKSHGHFIPEIANENSIELAKLKKCMNSGLLKLAREIEVDENLVKMRKMNEFYQSEIMAKVGIVGADKKLAETSKKIDENIKCYITGALYTEDVLGYGISAVQTGRQTNLSTPAELLSWSAYKNGQRQSTTKSKFEYFIPAFINLDHGPRNKEWMNSLKYCVEQIGKKVYNTADITQATYEIFPRLINTLVLEMFKLPAPATEHWYKWDEAKPVSVNMMLMEKFEDDQVKAAHDNARCNKSPSIAFFEAICSLWRTYLWLNENVLKTKLLPKAIQKIDNFTKNENLRLKSVTPDVGSLLASYTAIQHHCKSSNQEFTDALLDETFTRNVLWWKRAGNVKQNAEEVFTATDTSRKIVLFQIFFLRFIIGQFPGKTAILLDATNGKAPHLLEKFFKEWKSAESIGYWADYLKKTGCSTEFQKKSGTALVNEAVKKAQDRGSAYYPMNNRR